MHLLSPLIQYKSKSLQWKRSKNTFKKVPGLYSAGQEGGHRLNSLFLFHWRQTKTPGLNTKSWKLKSETAGKLESGVNLNNDQWKQGRSCVWKLEFSVLFTTLIFQISPQGWQNHRMVQQYWKKPCVDQPDNDMKGTPCAKGQKRTRRSLISLQACCPRIPG